MALLFQIEDVGSWLKNLRLHKYGSLFSQLSYEEMLGLNEEYLESKVGRQLVMAVHPSYIYSFRVRQILGPDARDNLKK